MAKMELVIISFPFVYEETPFNKINSATKMFAASINIIEM